MSIQDASVMGYNAAVATAVRLYKSGCKAVLVLGPPGTGKTAMRYEIAKQLGLSHIFMLKLSHHDVPDVAGVPVPDDEDKRTHFYASADMLPASDLTGGVFMVHDETTDQNIAQQNLTCQMVFEGKIHNYDFPENTFHFLTGNRVQDKSGANRLVTKLGNRVAIITVTPTPDELFQYGAMNGWNPTVLAFIKMKGNEQINPSDQRGENAPTYFNSFDPSDPAQLAKPQFASSRSYEAVSKYMNYIEEHEPGLEAGNVASDVAALLGTPVALALVAFRNIAMTMPDPERILEGKPVPYPTKQEVLWALTLTLASRCDKKNLQNVHDFLDKGPPEYLALAARIVYDTKMPAISGPALHKLIASPKLKSMFSGN